jgi:glutamate carboxypeptidase
VIDMKGGDVIIVYALRALREAKALDRMNITIVFDGDEEESGSPLELSRATLMDAAKGATAALGFEDGAGDPKTAMTSRRGAGSWKLEVTGTPSHSGQIFTPEVGAGAVFEAARVLDQFYTKLGHEQYLTFNPGVALGGTAVTLDSTGTVGTASGKDNVVAEHMQVTGDLRTISPEQFQNAVKVMKEIVATPLPGTHSKISFETGYPPMAPTEGNRKLLAIYDKASRDVGSGGVVAVDPARAGAADISFVANLVPMSIDALGLSGHDDHTDKETADLRMLPVKTKRTAVFLLRLTNGAVKMPNATTMRQ